MSEPVTASGNQGPTLKAELDAAAARAAEENSAAEGKGKANRGGARAGAGRPRKNGAKKDGEAPKAKLPPMPPILINFLSELPLDGAKYVAGEMIAKEKLPPLDPKTLAAVHDAFRVWIESLEVALGPGGQLLIVYMAALGEIGFQAGAIRIAKELAKAQEEAARKAGAQQPSAQQQDKAAITVDFTKRQA